MRRFLTPFSTIALVRYESTVNCDDYNCDNRGRPFVNRFNAENTFRQFQKETSQFIYETSSHVTLVGFLHDYAELLQKGVFIGSNGSHARLLQGPKGIGKSFVLERFTVYCPTVYPNVIPIYLTFNDLRLPGSALRKSTILELVITKLKEAGLVDSNQIVNRKDIVEILRKNGKYLLLIVDELDQLYRVSNSLTELGHDNLGEFLYLGNQISGRVVVLLCGSSASCPLLVTCHANEKEFPLQHGAPHLNGTKYKTKRIPADPFLHLDILPNMLERQEERELMNVKIARLISFAVGLNARAVSTFMKELQQSRSNENIYGLWKSAEHESGLRMVSSDSYPLYQQLMQRFLDKNSELLKSLMENGEITVDKVMEYKWEKEFQPLSQLEVLDVWEKLQMSQGKAISHEVLQHYLFELCDRDQLTFVGINNGLPETLYPMNLSQVFLEFRKPHWANTFINSFNYQLAQFGVDVRKRLAEKVVEKYFD